MAFTVTGKIEGLDQLAATLKSIDDKVREQAVKKGVDAASDVVVKAAQANLQTATGNKLLSKSIGKKVKKYRSGLVVGVIGPRKGFRKQVGVRKRDGAKGKAGDPIYEDPAAIAHLVELGHLGPHPAPAHAFLRPAFDGTKGKQLDAVGQAVTEVVNKS